MSLPRTVDESGVTYVEQFYQDVSSGSFIKTGKIPIARKPPSSTLYDDFSTNWTITDGQTSPNGKWKLLFGGGGLCESKNGVLTLTPAAVSSPSQTRGASLMTTKMFKDFDFSASVKTVKQLRTGSTPNNWEVAWLDWARSDSISDIVELRFHAYGFTLKRDGWQLEKKDNETQDDTAEIYLVTNNDPDCKLNISQKWRVRVTGTDTGTPTIQIWIDNVEIANYLDNKIPLNSEKMKRRGPIVLYTEDALTNWDNINIIEL